MAKQKKQVNIMDSEEFYAEKEYIGEKNQIGIFLSEIKEGIVGSEEEFFNDGTFKEGINAFWIDVKSIPCYLNMKEIAKYVLEFCWFYELNCEFDKTNLSKVRFNFNSVEDFNKLKIAYWLEMQRLGYYSQTVKTSQEALKKELKRQEEEYGKYIRKHLPKLKEIYPNVDETLPPKALYYAITALEKNGYCEDAPAIQTFSNICVLYDEFGYVPDTICRVTGCNKEDVKIVLNRVKRTDKNGKR